MNPSHDKGDAGERERWVSEQLAALDASGTEALSADAVPAWSRFRTRLETMAPRRRRPFVWMASAAGLALVGALGFSPAARSATVRVLSLFRITQVTALPLDVNGSAPVADRTTSAMIQQLLSDDVNITRDDPSQAADGPAAASQLAGFTVRVPAGLNAQYRVQGEKDFQLLVDRSRAQAILDSAGVVGVSLPPGLDGSSISVHLPANVVVMLGDCQGQAVRGGLGISTPPRKGNCTILGESPSPAVSLPPGLDMQKIAEAGLQLLGMSAEEAQQYCQTVDWTSTLVVPFPRSEMQSRTVPVDGVNGILFTPVRSDAPPVYMLLWSRQGMLYSVAGPGDGSQGLSIAAQLPPA